MRLRHTVLVPAAVLAVLTAAAPADAAFFKGEAIDSGAGIKRVGDVDLSRDGSGAVAYVKDDAIFVARLVNGAFQPPEQVDAGLGGTGSDPVVAASDGGRVVVAYVKSGQIYGAVRPANGTFGPAQQLAPQGSAPAVDMSINGVAYVTWTAPGSSGADVRAARLASGATAFTLLPTPLDIDPARDAGVGQGASEVAVSADGTAVVVFGEAGHVWGRRLFETRVSTAPQDLSVDSLAGHAGDPNTATDPHIDIEDDSSYAWVTFRQTFDDGLSHTVARRLLGSQFEAPVAVDGTGFGGDQAQSSSIGMNGRGEGLMATGTAAKGVFVSVLHDDTPFPAVQVNQANNVAPRPAADFAENNDGIVTWFQGTSALTATVQAARYDVPLDKRTVPGPAEVTDISNPDFGPVDVTAGLDAAVDRVGDGIAVFVQGVGDARKLVSAGYDRVPGIFTTSTTQRYRNLKRPQLAWSPSFDLWGPLSYRVEVDNAVVGTVSDMTRLTLQQPLADGVHPWRVTATDRHGQTNVTKGGLIKVDTVPPTLRFAVRGVRNPGRLQTVSAQTTDPKAPAPATTAGSGVSRVLIDFGDGARAKSRVASHAYGSPGAYTVRVSSTDVAGNVTVVTKRITIQKTKKSKKKKS